MHTAQLWLWTQAGSRQGMVPGRLQAYSSYGCGPRQAPGKLQAYSSYGCGPRQAPGNIWSQAGSRHTAAMTVDPGRLQATHGPRQAPGIQQLWLWTQAGSRQHMVPGRLQAMQQDAWVCGPRQAPGNAARCMGPWSQAGSRHIYSSGCGPRQAPGNAARCLGPWSQAGSRHCSNAYTAVVPGRLQTWSRHACI